MSSGECMCYPLHSIPLDFVTVLTDWSLSGVDFDFDSPGGLMMEELQ